MRRAETFWLILATSIVCFLPVEASQNESSSSPSSSPSSSSTLPPSSAVTAVTEAVTLVPARPRGTTGKPIRCDLYCCNCPKDKARCTGQDQRKFHYLPQLPARTRDFRMFRSRFHHLTRAMMSNLSNFELTTVNLTNNRIVHIDPDAFADFPKIKFLDLSYNLIAVAELKAVLQGVVSPALSTLDLEAMGHTSLPDHFFQVFRGRVFKKVDLQKNRFSSFNSALFLPFHRIDIVNLNDNVITDVNVSVRVNIKGLLMKHNRLETFPDLSLNRSQTRGEADCRQGFYYLQHLILENNPLRDISPHLLRGDCFPHLRRLDISLARSLVVLQNNVVADLPELLTLVVNQNNIKTYQPYAFNSSSLQTLNLDRSTTRLDKQAVSFRHMFSHCPNLKTLTLVNTKLEMDPEQMYQWLSPLRSVQFLNMQKNRKGSIPPNLLRQLTNLTKLIFAGNNLNSDSLGRALEGVSHLRQLNVQGNGITEVNQSTLPWPFRQHVQQLDLSQNPFSCTCDMIWFRDWVDAVRKNGTVNVRNFDSRQYRCRTPVDLFDVPLHQFKPTAESCAVKNPWVVVGLVGGCFLLGLVATLSLSYRYRWHLRYYVYRLRRRRQYVQVPGGLLREEGGVQLYPYDAYLAHSPKDVDWVVGCLLPLVEGEHGFKVFLDERDSVPGTNLVDNITRYMDESARVMLLISDHYTRDGWRQCEFEHILYAAFEQQKDVIVLLLGDVEAGRMTKDMRKMLTRGTFLQWGESEEAQKAFSNGLKIALKTTDDSFHTLC